MKSALVVVVQNARGLVFVAGAAWLYHGVAAFSPPAANVIAGALLMAVGAYPYLRLKRKA